jgi:uncharacterized membrane protein YesL
MKKERDMVQFGDSRKNKILNPETESEWFTYMLKFYWKELIGMNLLTLLLFLPVVTYPAAICGMTNIIMLRLREKRVEFWKDYFAEFRNQFFRRLLWVLILTAAPLSLSLYPYILGFEKGGSVVLLLAGGVSFLIQAYMFPMMVTVDIPVAKAFKNSLIIMAIEWKTTLKILFTSGVLILLCVIFFLYMIPLVVIILLSLVQLINSIYSKKAIEKWATKDVKSQ